MQKKSDIRISVTLDANQHPMSIDWQADDSGIEGMQQSKGLMLALFDKKDNTTMRIDLWTTEMMVEQMQVFFYETLSTMAETYDRATNDKPLAEEIRNFAMNFGRKAGILKA
jgi:gliding motility-associated protein GldC